MDKVRTIIDRMSKTLEVITVEDLALKTRILNSGLPDIDKIKFLEVLVRTVDNHTQMGKEFNETLREINSIINTIS